MKLTYFTTKSYPATTADHIYIKELSRGFQELLKENFCLVVSKSAHDTHDLNTVLIKKRPGPKLLSSLLHVIQNSKKYRQLGSENVFITNDYYVGLILCILKPYLFSHTRIIFDCHLLTETWVDSYVLPRMNKIICTSKVLAENVLLIVKNKDNVCVVWGGVDVDSYKKLRPFSKESKMIKVGYVGGFKSLGDDKGLKTLIDSLNYLDEHFTVFLTGGDNKDVLDYEEYSKTQKLNHRVSIRGRIPLNKVSIYLNELDILVIPYPDKNHFRKYGFPMKVFEYLSVKKPIVYSNLRIIADYLAQYSHAVSFIPDDSSSLARSIVQASQYKGNYEYELDQFSWLKKAENIINNIT